VNSLNPPRKYHHLDESKEKNNVNADSYFKTEMDVNILYSNES